MQGCSKPKPIRAAKGRWAKFNLRCVRNVLFAFWSLSCDCQRHAEAVSTLPQLWMGLSCEFIPFTVSGKGEQCWGAKSIPQPWGSCPGCGAHKLPTRGLNSLRIHTVGHQPYWTTECPYQPRDRDSGTSTGLTKGQDSFLLWNHSKKNLHAFFFFLSYFFLCIFDCCNVWIRSSWFRNVSVVPGCSLLFPVGKLVTQSDTQHNMGRRNEVW